MRIRSSAAKKVALYFHVPKLLGKKVTGRHTRRENGQGTPSEIGKFWRR